MEYLSMVLNPALICRSRLTSAFKEENWLQELEITYRFTKKKTNLKLKSSIRVKDITFCKLLTSNSNRIPLIFLSRSNFDILKHDLELKIEEEKEFFFADNRMKHNNEFVLCVGKDSIFVTVPGKKRLHKWTLQYGPSIYPIKSITNQAHLYVNIN